MHIIPPYLIYLLCVRTSFYQSSPIPSYFSSSIENIAIKQLAVKDVLSNFWHYTPSHWLLVTLNNQKFTLTFQHISKLLIKYIMSDERWVKCVVSPGRGRLWAVHLANDQGIGNEESRNLQHNHGPLHSKKDTSISSLCTKLQPIYTHRYY